MMSKLAQITLAFALTFAATASVTAAEPTREQYIDSFPRDNAIAIRFGTSTSESFVVVDLGEIFSRLMIRKLFLEGPDKLRGTIYLSIYTAGWTGDQARRAAEYIYCGAGGDQISRLKEAAEEGFQPSPIQGNCNLEAVEKNSRTKLDGIPVAFLGDRFSPGMPSIEQLVTAEAVARSTQQQQSVSTSSSAAPLKSNTGSTADMLNGAPCRPTMAFLEARIPNFSAPELQQMRQAILAENVKVTMSKAKAQGFSIQGAIKATLDQAKEFDRVSRQAAQCAADVDALGATDDSFLASMQQGKAPRACSGIRNNCLCAGVLNRMSAVGARALAAEMQCFARRGD